MQLIVCTDDKDDVELDEEWTGLTVNTLRDIYSVHKVFMFGAFKFKAYHPSDFRNDIVRAERPAAEKGIFDDGFVRTLWSTMSIFVDYRCIHCG